MPATLTTSEREELLRRLMDLEVHVQPSSFHPRSGDCTAKLGHYNAHRVLELVCLQKE